MQKTEESRLIKNAKWEKERVIIDLQIVCGRKDVRDLIEKEAEAFMEKVAGIVEKNSTEA